MNDTIIMYYGFKVEIVEALELVAMILLKSQLEKLVKELIHGFLLFLLRKCTELLTLIN